MHDNNQSQPAQQSPKTVFISYAHEGNLSQHVEALADWLTHLGIQVITDHPYKNRPPENGWQIWMLHSIRDADLVLCVCTNRYKDLFEKHEPPTGNTDGKGCTYEAALITQSLYDDKLKNGKVFPIAPDALKAQSDPEQYIPTLLKTFSNSHYFPSGNERIKSLIVDQVIVPKPTNPLRHFVLGELQGPNDNRLAPTEIEFIGRHEEVDEVVAFLNSTASSAAVTSRKNTATQSVVGTGGIGKTEVCKAALKAWLQHLQNQQQPLPRVIWVDVPESEDIGLFTQQLAKAIGLSQEAIAQLQSLEELLPLLPEALYYLDNLEFIAGTTQGISTLKLLQQKPNIRLLASSRVNAQRVFPNSIEIDRLDADNAFCLWLNCWNGKALSEEQKQQAREFVDKDLGGHALSISLMAKQGQRKDLDKLIKRWRTVGTQFAKHRKDKQKLSSLDISIRLSQEQVAQSLGALELWQFISLFNEIPEYLIAIWQDRFAELVSNNDPDIDTNEIAGEALDTLLQNHIIQRRGTEKDDTLTCYYKILPPIARYALEKHNNKIPSIQKRSSPSFLLERDSSNRQNKIGFNWPASAVLSYSTFIQLSRHAQNDIDSQEKAISTIQSAQQLWAIINLVQHSQNLDPQGQQHFGNLVKQLHKQLINTYSLNLLAALKLLPLIRETLADRLTAHKFGYMHSHTSSVQEANDLYNNAIQLFQQRQNSLGLASATKALGDLHLLTGNTQAANTLYNNTIQRFEQEQNNLGLANATKALGDLFKHTGNVQKAEHLYNDAIQRFTQEQNNLGLANASQALGDLLRGNGNTQKANNLYDNAAKLFTQEQDNLRLANVYLTQAVLRRIQAESQDRQALLEKSLSLFISEQEFSGEAHVLVEMLRCNDDIKELKNKLNLRRAAQAILASLQSNFESIQNYVLSAIFEICGKDDAIFHEFLAEVPMYINKQLTDSNNPEA